MNCTGTSPVQFLFLFAREEWKLESAKRIHLNCIYFVNILLWKRNCGAAKTTCDDWANNHQQQSSKSKQIIITVTEVQR